jgi:hypothetical protein
MFDAERQIRFLYPPVFLVASLCLGARLDPDVTLLGAFTTLTAGTLGDAQKLDQWSAQLLAIVLASGLIVMIASGFLISSVSVLALRTVFALFRGHSYEAGLSHEAYARIRQRLQIPKPQKADSDALYLSATFDHKVIPEEIHRWVFRRWSMFYLATNSATAIILAQPVGWLLGIADWWWFVASLGAIAMLIAIAAFAWLDTMNMLDFQTLCPTEWQTKGKRNG